MRDNASTPSPTFGVVGTPVLRFDFRQAVAETCAGIVKYSRGFQTPPFLSRQQLEELLPRLEQLRLQLWQEVTSLEERERASQPADHGFIMLPTQLLREDTSTPQQSLLKRICVVAERIRELADRVVILGIGGSYLGARALAEALLPAYHNEFPAPSRRGVPRYYFEGNGLDNDTLADLLELLRPSSDQARSREERTALVVVSKSGTTLETAAIFRILYRHWRQWHPVELVNNLLIVVTECQPTSRLYQVAQAIGLPQPSIFPIPKDVGGRFSVFTPAGLIPAAILGLDTSRLLQGAADMTKAFLELSPGENVVLQYAAVNYLYFAALQKPIRVLSVWSKKLEALGLWYDQLVSESLGKNETGPTPITAVQTRDLHSRGQQHQEGARDRIIHNLVVEQTRHPPLSLGQFDGNADGLNAVADKSIPELLQAAWLGTNQAYAEDFRPTTDIVLHRLDEYCLGQLMQMLMLATVIEGRLLGVNPYGQPGVEAYKRNMRRLLGLA